MAKVKLDYLSGAESFLDPLRSDADRPNEAKAVVSPYALEASISYGGGTVKGPAAIMAASHQLELFDEELWREPYADYGIAALKPPKVPRSVPKALDQLEGLVGAVLDLGKLPFVLGGEHSLTAGAIRPFAKRFQDLVVRSRAIGAEIAVLVDHVRRSGVYLDDCHRNVNAWCRANGRWSDAEASTVKRVGRFLADHPDVAAMALAGRVGTMQIERLARSRG